MREANKREDRQSGMTGALPSYTGMESEIAPATAAESQMMQARMSQGWGTSGQMAQTTAAENRMTQAPMSQGTGEAGQMTLQSGAEPDMIYDGYGTEHDRASDEEDGMTSIPQDSFNTPLNADEAARNSWRALLARNVGRNVLVRFLMGTQNLITVEGELYEVGTDYIVLYQPLWDSHITADLYSVKFVEFREPPGVMTLG